MPIPTPRQAAEELARRSLSDFARTMIPALDLTPFHRSYYDTLDRFARGEIRRLIVSIPPQHGKSLGSSVLLPAYLLGRQPDRRIALASYNLRLASRFNRQIQRLMDASAYRSIFPRTRLKRSSAKDRGTLRTAEEFELVGSRGGLLSVGRDGALTGRPVDVFILDDLYKNAQEANSPLVRDHAWDWYNAVVKTRLHNDSQELLVFTRWHEDDLIGRIAAREPITDINEVGQRPAGPSSWLRLNFEAVKQGSPTSADPRRQGEPLWPARHSSELLEQKRRLDPMLFETMYQGNPSSAEGVLYGDRFATYDKLPERTIKKGNYTDTADSGEDYLCSVCYETGTDDTIYITDVLYTPLGMEATEPLVAAMLQRNGTRTARIESNNGGRGFARAVAKLCPQTRIEWFHQYRNKEARVLSNATEVAARIRMPEDWHRRWSEFYGDVVSFRRLFRSNRRDDAPDVLTGIVETESAGPGKCIRRSDSADKPAKGRPRTDANSRAFSSENAGCSQKVS